MKAALTTTLLALALALSLSACGGQEHTAKPAAVKHTQANSYSQEDFIRDVRAAGWHPDSQVYASAENQPAQQIEYGLYLEAVRFCQLDKSGEEEPTKYLSELGVALISLKNRGDEPPSADVNAYLIAVKKTCGLK